MTTLTLHHREILPPGALVHLVRAPLMPGRPRSLHGHDFCELFWVQNGRVRHHLPDGTEDLSEGDLVFVAPRHAHALQALGEAALVVSVTLHPQVSEDLPRRHPQLLGRQFWTDGPRPERQHRDPRQLALLNQAALRLEAGPPDRLAAEGFLLPLLAQLAVEGRLTPPGAPDWLVAACIAANDPRVFREGAGGFARIAGRAHAHVSRSARRFLGMSPSDYVNQRRMEHAARQLAGSGDTLAEIAADCGIPNLSHFHKLFRAHHGTTPQRYRRARQRMVLQPDLARTEAEAPAVDLPEETRV